MTQFDPGPLTPIGTSGAAMCTLVAGWRGAVHTTHKGPGRPSYVQTGMIWLDDSADPWLVKLAISADADVVIQAVSPSTGGTMFNAYYTKTESDDRRGIIAKGNLAGLGQVPIALPADYQYLRLVLLDVNYTAANPMFMQFSPDNGVNWYQAATDYETQADVSEGTAHRDSITTGAAIALATFGSRLFSTIDIDPGSGSQFPSIMSNSKYYANGNSLSGSQRWGHLNTTIRVKALRIFPGAGLFQTGRYILTGVK